MNPTKDGQLKCIAGDAYMALVLWDKNGNLTSESIHQFGSAISNKSSEHYADQAYLFSEERLKPSLLNLEACVRCPHCRRRLLGARKCTFVLFKL